MTEVTPAKALEIVSLAWGKQQGYAFFPTISGTADTKAERIQSYQEGRAWRWPRDRDKIVQFLEDHRGDDVYWCPNLFEYPRRKADLAMDEMALWADLDEVDPRMLDEAMQPTIAWETSPGRYQALWLAAPGHDMQGASWPGRENQRLTYAIGADQGGWDTTQLLRLPGWPNHKPEYRDANGGTPPVCGLVWGRWKSRRRFFLDDMAEILPEVEQGAGQFDTILEDVVDKIDVHDLWGRVRLKLPSRTRELYRARSAGGDRSETLWSIERDLADAGLAATEIVALVKGTVWNKYAGRQDELRRLTVEANKAVALRVDPPETDEESSEGKPRPESLWTLIKNVKPAKWLVKDVWTEASCGFIAGQPKLTKSWVAFDLALSVATGTPFLGHFPIVRPGPVLYVQEEDTLPEIKRRFNLVWPGKIADKVTMGPSGELWWEPPTSADEPDVSALVQAGVILSDPGWQSWLDEVLAEGRDGRPYSMVVADPLLMMLGDVDENKAASMTEQLFKPLKQLATKHAVAVALVHHMRKGQHEGRGGQMMLGSVANHAWSQDALYMSYDRDGNVDVERESKSAPYLRFKIRGSQDPGTWHPKVTDVRGMWDDEDTTQTPMTYGKPGEKRRIDPDDDPGCLAIMSEVSTGSTWSVEDLADRTGLSESAIRRRTKILQAVGKLRKVNNRWAART